MIVKEEKGKKSTRLQCYASPVLHLSQSFERVQLIDCNHTLTFNQLESDSSSPAWQLLGSLFNQPGSIMAHLGWIKRIVASRSREMILPLCSDKNSLGVLCLGLEYSTQEGTWT